MMRTLASPFVLAAAVLVAAPIAAQEPCPELDDPTGVDRVVAVVGDSIILFSELAQECQILRQTGNPAPPRQILDQLVAVEILLQHAVRDSTLIPSESEVNQRADQQIERARGLYADEATFQAALAQEGLTVTALRDRYRDDIRSSMIRQAYELRMLQSTPPVPVTEAELLAYYEQRRSELQQRPELLTVQQVLIQSGASDQAWDEARQTADSLHALIVAGADFAELARAHSEDPGTAEQGGDLGWVPRGLTAGEFERAAFALMDGTMSPPVRTEFGYHIILAERSRPGTGERRLRHILIAPESDPSDLERSRQLGQEVAERMRAGETALSLAQTYGDPEVPREFYYPRGDTLTALPPAFIERLATAEEGDVIGPFDVTLNFDYVAVLYVSEVREAGEFTFEDLREQIREVLAVQKRQERILEDLRERTYVDIRFPD